ncbi:NADH:ubiquinone reductase (Na(+)-transporting) subunit D [Flammeovirga kamogawensis]|uniref:Na(+)-translocating NADH-quinone reductase subunit D n=1 Tax=Flammeovirga kamogawensis TaxID=373891 RepID=A0ABX8GVL3_9BACT|nr:NADH:ubiquinone reductase (Na(+)-transporting) subunit D [Flammeovirga kamogawensis]MBB6461689.1 Na+-transporting NADH:ubiquinone oxidoreductase subunit D [Flammeovirga kamogawensis]QWG07386.1 NADH:ubiquinone reductase (Na(+)-transporting) subunit D [Flammeovirga kamogawensis]TRX69199.1 NADH:ubiquinone reductase (Na(+)-transporting) subunit D [Flammeovirga kamogawensis]
MSTETVAAKKSEALFSKRRKAIVTDPLDDDNPVTVQVLGICSALAVTSKLEPTLVMSIAVTFVVIFSNLIVSLLRNAIPQRIRIIVQLGIVASLVIIVDQVLKAYLYDVSKVVGVYVGLIITNCIVMGRLEAFAMANKPYDSILDGLGSSFGYAWVILVVAFFRELLGSGTLFDIRVLPEAYVNNGLMTSPVGAFILIGLIIWVQRWRNGYVEEA